VSACTAAAASLLFAGSMAKAQDNAVDPLLAASEEDATVSTVSFGGDLWLGQDHVSGLPNGRADLNRTRGRLRYGANWMFAPSWEFVGSLRIAQGSDDNKDNRRNNDNERSDSFGVDQVLLRWRASEDASLQFGKAPLPLDLSPMLWDPDLRPVGIAYERSFARGDFDRLRLVAGYFAGDHLYGDDSRIGALQLGWNWREGAPMRGSAQLSWLDFSSLDELARQGLGRTNALVGGDYRSDFRLLDLQLGGHLDAGAWPIDLRIDLVRNVGADDDRDGGRVSLSVGDPRQPHGLQFGVALHRIQRDAVLAAFGSDDWWFHSNMRGQLVWVAYGIDQNWNLRLSGFRELRDGLSEHTHRLRFDIKAEW
jgi:hypothetical protein